MMIYRRVLFITIYLLFSYNTCSAQNKAASGGDQLLFLQKKHIFGMVDRDTLLTARFYFVNIGDENVHIEYVNPECSCTGYVLSAKDIAPKDTAFIELSYNTKGKYGLQKVYTVVRANTHAQMYKLTMIIDIDER